MELVTFLILVAAIASAVAYDTESSWFVRTVDGIFWYASKEAYESEASVIQARNNVAKFYLYTKSNANNSKQINTNDSDALSSSNFNKSHPTRILIHGFLENLNASVNNQVRSALFDTGNYNVITVDWSSKSNPFSLSPECAIDIEYISENFRGYIIARNAVPSVGMEIAAFIDFLNLSGGMNFETLGIIGFSLGAHVAGYAGKYVKRGRVNTIHGLDPARPGFDYNDCSTRLCSTDAVYVESIHTDGNLNGFVEPIGKAAFYPNGGKTQPGCHWSIICAHERAILYYAEAIRRNDFPSIKCSTYKNALDKNCGNTYSTVRMGSASNNGISGYYYVPIKKRSPFGMYS